MSTALATQSQTNLVAQTAQELNISSSYLQLVKNTFAKGATDNELSLFLRTANHTGLDPSARQIFMVKRWDSSIKDFAMSIQISIDGFRLIADRSGKYAPSREPSFAYDANGDVESATSYVKKFVGGEWHEIAATAFYSEYVQTTKEGKPNSMWQKMPRLMLAKCAESLVLRRAFPAELSGLYTSDEMGTDEAQSAKIYEAEVVVNPRPTTKSRLIENAKPTNVELDPLNKQLADICGELNKTGDATNWKKSTLAEYATTLFDRQDALDSAFDLTDEEKQILLDDLNERLQERLALSDN